MGVHINVGNSGFQRARNSEYVDKSELIAIVNQTLFTEHCFSCVSRCRRFGKSMAAKMLCAYYDQSSDSRQLFADLKIAQDATFEKHLNKYPTIFLDLSDFVSRYKSDDIVRQLNGRLIADIQAAYPDVPTQDGDDLMDYLVRITSAKHIQFFFIIDEWDAIYREFQSGTTAMDDYVGWLRRLFKGGQSAQVFAGAYLTGILPIKKYKTESALNNFTEYSMVNPGRLAGYYGFTKDEVQALCRKHDADFDELEKWYDGYKIGDEPSVFNPNSVMQAIWGGKCRSYWANTGAYDTVGSYVQMNFEGLKDDIISMLGGGRCKVNPTGFQNDMSVIRDKNDVLTVLIHLGYLAYDWDSDECYIPNREVEGEMVNAIKDTNWQHVIESINESQTILQAVLNGDEQTVARCIDKAHDENTSILSYNNENSLACVLSLAFYYAKNDYTFHRELPTGKGFADIVLMPRKNTRKPAILLELKYGKSANAAIEQIHRKEYQSKIVQDAEEIILVGINYDPKSKKHECKIESI
ncbi:MAG: ATP-binding protein [Prevotella sp.]|nr:ATP-binding protein [Prevotella sp.]